MRILEPPKAFLRATALLLALTAAAHAQGPGGGSGNGGGSGGPGGNGAGGRSGGGGPGGSAPDSDAPSGTSRPREDPSSATGTPPAATAGTSTPPALDSFVHGPEGALDAVEANQALPLDQIVAATRHLTDGEIIDARLNAVNGALQYEVKVLETTGEVRRFLFDARTAQLAEVR